MSCYKTLIEENWALCQEISGLRVDLAREIESLTHGPECVGARDVITRLAHLVPLEEEVE